MFKNMDKNEFLLNNKLNINKFKIESIEKNAAIVMIAKRGSGKSWICRDLLWNFKDIPCGMVISPTDKVDPFYKNFVPDIFIHHEYKSSIIERLLARQNMVVEHNEINPNNKIDERVFVVMDDCMSSKNSWSKDQFISTLLFEGRHFHITYILTMQFPLGLSPELRNNFDYIFILADDNISNQKRIYEHYAGMFPNFYVFRDAYAEITKDYGAMVICNRGVRNNLNEKVFWYKAQNFANIDYIGCKMFAKYHDKKYNKNWKKKKKTHVDVDIANDKKKNKFIVVKNYDV